MPKSKLLSRRNLGRLAAAGLAGYWLAIFVSTHWPTTPSFVHDNNDKIWHFLGYTGLAALCTAAWALHREVKIELLPLKHVLLVVLLVAAYGGFDELTQPLVGRTCDIHDWAADLLGICAGIALVEWLLLVAGKLLPDKTNTKE